MVAFSARIWSQDRLTFSIGHLDYLVSIINVDSVSNYSLVLIKILLPVQASLVDVQVDALVEEVVLLRFLVVVVDLGRGRVHLFVHSLVQAVFHDVSLAVVCWKLKLEACYYVLQVLVFGFDCLDFVA